MTDFLVPPTRPILLLEWRPLGAPRISKIRYASAFPGTTLLGDVVVPIVPLCVHVNTADYPLWLAWHPAAWLDGGDPRTYLDAGQRSTAVPADWRTGQFPHRRRIPPGARFTVRTGGWVAVAAERRWLRGGEGAVRLPIRRAHYATRLGLSPDTARQYGIPSNLADYPAWYEPLGASGPPTTARWMTHYSNPFVDCKWIATAVELAAVTIGEPAPLDVSAGTTGPVVEPWDPAALIPLGTSSGGIVTHGNTKGA